MTPSWVPSSATSRTAPLPICSLILAVTRRSCATAPRLRALLNQCPFTSERGAAARSARTSRDERALEAHGRAEREGCCDRIDHLGGPPFVRDEPARQSLRDEPDF